MLVFRNFTVTRNLLNVKKKNLLLISPKNKTLLPASQNVRFFSNKTNRKKKNNNEENENNKKKKFVEKTEEKAMDKVFDHFMKQSKDRLSPSDQLLDEFPNKKNEVPNSTYLPVIDEHHIWNHYYHQMKETQAICQKELENLKEKSKESGFTPYETAKTILEISHFYLPQNVVEIETSLYSGIELLNSISKKVSTLKTLFKLFLTNLKSFFRIKKRFYFYKVFGVA